MTANIALKRQMFTLWPVLKWVKRLIDGVLIEDFGEEDIEFAPRI